MLKLQAGLFTGHVLPCSPVGVVSGKIPTPIVFHLLTSFLHVIKMYICKYRREFIMDFSDVFLCLRLGQHLLLVVIIPTLVLRNFIINLTIELN